MPLPVQHQDRGQDGGTWASPKSSMTSSAGGRGSEGRTLETGAGAQSSVRACVRCAVLFSQGKFAFAALWWDWTLD